SWELEIDTVEPEESLAAEPPGPVMKRPLWVRFKKAGIGIATAASVILAAFWWISNMQDKQELQQIAMDGYQIQSPLGSSGIAEDHYNAGLGFFDEGQYDEAIAEWLQIPEDSSTTYANAQYLLG